MGSSYSRWLLPILVIVAAAAWIVWPGNPGIHAGSIDRSIRVVRGLDLQGGLRVLLEADLPADTPITSDQIQTARDIVENRVNGLGLTEPVVQVAGARRILVELPGVEDPDQAIATLRETGLLEFVDMSVLDPSIVAGLQGQVIQTDYGQTSEGPSPTNAGPTSSVEASDGTPTSDATEGSPTPVATASEAPSAVSGLPVLHTVMTGAALQDATAIKDQVGSNYGVQFTLTDEASQVFADFTRSHVGQPLAIVLDKRVISTPVIDEPITQGSGVIRGTFTIEEANSLAIQLRYGALPVPLKVVEIRTVGPTLGEDSLRKSTLAGAIGLAVVMAFMALYYRLPGIVADMALLIYAAVTFALFKLIPVTLTLPAIAGFVLSIGVAVDANILIFERLKEELRAGRSLRQAIDLGFSRAWPSIRDSNLSTLITCAILFWFGNTFGASIVKGFSLTLALGVLVSLFTAITVTRVLLHVVLEGLEIGKHPRWFGI